MDNVAGDLEDLRYQRNKVDRKLDVLQYSHQKRLHNPKQNNKKHKKRIRSLESRLDRIQSDIYSKRNELSELRSWRSTWLYKLDQ